VNAFGVHRYLPERLGGVPNFGVRRYLPERLGGVPNFGVRRYLPERLGGVPKSYRLSVTLLVVVAAAISIRPADRIAAQDRATAPLTTTAHAPLPGHPSLYWLVPETSLSRTGAAQKAAETPESRFARGAELIADTNFAAGLPLIANADLTKTPLAQYSHYYAGIALLGLGRAAEADAVFTTLADANLTGFLKEAVPLRRAEVALALGTPKKAADILDDLSDEKLTAPEDVLVRLGLALEAAGDRAKALEAFRRVYYEYPLSAQASDAQAGIERLQTADLVPPDRFKLELARAERLFTARRWAQARAGFAPLGAVARNDDKEHIDLRLAECDYYLNRQRAARDALLPYLEKSSRKAEARFFHLTATRSLGDIDTYLALANRFIEDFPGDAWTEETLNNLASHYVIENDDAAADQVFRELYARFPKGRYSDRAAWKIGWWAYKNGRYIDAAGVFESAAAAFPRADFRPAWLYWAARSRDKTGEVLLANARYQLVASDYLNSYYGRLASRTLAERLEPPVQPIVRWQAATPMPSPLVPNDPVIRALVSVELYDDALNEVQYAQRAWGDSPALQATIAWIRHQRALEEKSNDRFSDLRGAITIMRRAYPQFLAAGGENLPPDVLRVIFPLDYWPLIKKYSEAHGLDPYLMTALIAQESTFTPDVRSAANAVGLMQLIPATGRRYARKVGIRYSAAVLTQPESNIRMGMSYFQELVSRFGGAYYALASYNAGEQRIARWIAERPGFEQDEFIDDIPYPETQNYVKRILGTAEDYRRLYGGGILTPGLEPPAPSKRPAAKPPAPKKPAATKKAPARPSRPRR
jgi:soluble lytic murein transglycosylase